MSWKDILKRDISFNPDEACCMELKRGYSELMRDLQEHYDRKGIKSNVAAMSRRRMNEPCKVLVDDLQSFYDNIMDLYQQNLNAYIVEYNKLVQDKGRI